MNALLPVAACSSLYLTANMYLMCVRVFRFWRKYMNIIYEYNIYAHKLSYIVLFALVGYFYIFFSFFLCYVLMISAFLFGSLFVLICS